MENKDQRQFKQTKDARETANQAWQRCAVAIEQAKSEEEVDQIFDDFKLQVKQLRVAQDAIRGG